MRVISKRKLREFWGKRPDAKEPLLDWYNVARKASWQNLAEGRESFRHADPVGGCTVFNIKGNDYRLITMIKWLQSQNVPVHAIPALLLPTHGVTLGSRATLPTMSLGSPTNHAVRIA